MNKKNNNTDIKGSVIASGRYEEVELPQDKWKTDINTGEVIKTQAVFKDNNNLQLNTNSLTYSDIYDTDTSKSQNIGAGIGSTVSFNYSNGGYEKEQTTKATIGNGSIVIANNEVNSENNNLNLIRDLNRDVNNSQEITKDENTGGWNMDVSVNVPGLIELTQDGFDKFTDKKLKEAKANTIELAQKTDKVVESIYDTAQKVGSAIGGDIGETIFDTMLKLTLGSTIGGVASAFGETNSKIIVAAKDENGNTLIDEKGNLITKTITRQEMSNGDYKNYEVLGIMSGENGAINEIKLKPNTAERTNPTDGFFGDLIECGLMKIFNKIGASDMMAMSREVSLDLKAISSNSNTSIENAVFHSQGTIIEQGGLQIYRSQYQPDIKLNPNLKYNSLGYAVYEDTLNNMFIEDFKFKINSETNKPLNVNFDRYDTDSIQQLTAPKSFGDFMNGIKNLIHIDTHSINNNKFDKYYDSINLNERIKIDMNRYGGKENTNYNLIRPGINNNGVNYVIPSYTTIKASDK